MIGQFMGTYDGTELLGLPYEFWNTLYDLGWDDLDMVTFLEHICVATVLIDGTIAYHSSGKDFYKALDCYIEI